MLPGGSATATALIGDDRVNAVSFTGSDAVGRQVIQLEMGVLAAGVRQDPHVRATQLLILGTDLRCRPAGDRSSRAWTGK